MATKDQPASIGQALWQAALLPLRVAVLPVMACLPPDARGHVRAAAREARAAVSALRPRPARSKRTPPLPDITLD